VGARRLRLPALAGGELLAAGVLAGAVALIGLLGVQRLGSVGLLAPLALALVAVMLSRPLAAVTLVVALAVICEGPSFGLLTFSQHLYTQVYRDISLLDVLVALAILAVGLDMLRHRRPLRVPRPLALPLALLALAMVAGVLTGRAGGATLRFAVASENILAYLLLLPLAVANLDIDRRRVLGLLSGAMALAIVKAVLGLIEVSGHHGAAIEGTATLTYYEPVANWLIMIAILAIFAALLGRVRLPLWVLLGSPLLVACLVLSYRRSFWIGAVLGLLLVLLLGTSPAGRRLLLPAALGIAAAIWLLGSVSFQSQLPIVKRVTSLAPSRLEANIEDRYRLDERANVLAAIRANPVTGLGVTIPWSASAQPLSIEHEEGRQYVHFAALWFWLKLGILGLFAYMGMMVGSMTLAWQVWRRSREGLLRAFGLASLCGMAGLVAIDTTASFTGVEGRFTLLFGLQVGLLALLARSAYYEDAEAPEELARMRPSASIE
jgi:hypothetical protein